MLRIEGHRQSYGWGSATAVPQILGVPGDGRPWAEHWYGTHPSGPSELTSGRSTLDAALRARPEQLLGPEVVARFGPTLPFLLKLIAPARPLSLQVHPDRARAEESFAAEEAAGLTTEDPRRTYRDPNHKPEMLVALTPFEALAGFRAPRKAAALLDGLDAPLARRLRHLLREQPDARGMRAAFRTVLSPEWGAGPEDVRQIADACRVRSNRKRSPSPRMDRIVAHLQEQHPGDPAVVAALLLNPVSLQPGEALYVPPGSVHAYLSGTGLEIMASSDNVLRAGLTVKRVDVEELLAATRVIAAPPVRIAPERLTRRAEVFYAPVDDFELTVSAPRNGDAAHRRILPGGGPRIVLCLDGPVCLRAGGGEAALTSGQAVFLGADDGQAVVAGDGRVIQAGVP